MDKKEYKKLRFDSIIKHKELGHYTIIMDNPAIHGHPVRREVVLPDFKKFKIKNMEDWEVDNDSIESLKFRISLINDRLMNVEYLISKTNLKETIEKHHMQIQAISGRTAITDKYTNEYINMKNELSIVLNELKDIKEQIREIKNDHPA